MNRILRKSLASLSLQGDQFSLGEGEREGRKGLAMGGGSGISGTGSPQHCPVPSGWGLGDRTFPLARPRTGIEGDAAQMFHPPRPYPTATVFEMSVP